MYIYMCIYIYMWIHCLKVTIQETHGLPLLVW